MFASLIKHSVPSRPYTEINKRHQSVPAGRRQETFNAKPPLIIDVVVVGWSRRESNSQNALLNLHRERVATAETWLQHYDSAS